MAVTSLFKKERQSSSFGNTIQAQKKMDSEGKIFIPTGGDDFETSRQGQTLQTAYLGQVSPDGAVMAAGTEFTLSQQQKAILGQQMQNLDGDLANMSQEMNKCLHTAYVNTTEQVQRIACANRIPVTSLILQQQQEIFRLQQALHVCCNDRDQKDEEIRITNLSKSRIEAEKEELLKQIQAIRASAADNGNSAAGRASKRNRTLKTKGLKEVSEGNAQSEKKRKRGSITAQEKWRKDGSSD